MDIKRLQELSIKNLEEKVRKVTLSTGDIIEIKDHLTINEKRVIARIISTSGMVIREGESVARIDKSLQDTAEVYAFIKYMTDIDIDGIELDELVDMLSASGLKEEIFKELDRKLVLEIRQLVNNYTQEEVRAQKVEGMLGYRAERLIESLDFNVDPRVLGQIVQSLDRTNAPE